MDMDQFIALGGQTGTAAGMFGTLLIGIVAGWIAEKLTGSDMGLIRNLITGVVGSIIGNWIANLAGINLAEIFSGWFWGNLLVSVVGAVIFLTIMKMIFGKKQTA